MFSEQKSVCFPLEEEEKVDAFHLVLSQTPMFSLLVLAV